MKKLIIGILAHVDAGKTTLAESMLYLTGSIRRLGRVDHKDAFLDNFELERKRGITIFSKQAKFRYKGMEVSLLDTPGHVDFSAEMERTLQVLDYAVLVISGSDGVQGHTETLWKLLARYGIPTYVFVNKMDLDIADRKALMAQLKKQLSDGCIDFSEKKKSKEFMETLALCDEALLERYMEKGVVAEKEIAGLIARRKVFPCYFGSALKLWGIDTFLDGLEQFTQRPNYPDDFGARVYKVARDDQGNRLTFMKITGGSLKVKMLLTNGKEKGSGRGDDRTDVWEEKVDQIRIYSGAKYETVDEVEAGSVCAVTGLSRTYPGEGLGTEAGLNTPFLEPVLNYRVLLPPERNAYSMLSQLRQLEEEDPLLRIVWSEHLKEIYVQLMGEVQVEILKSLILERFGVSVEFDSGNILYKETILEPVVGVGHFEPLGHYAEVHLLLEPKGPGSGLTFASSCSEDVLDRNWQRLILTHLAEKEHLGVLTGSPITDMKITLIAGRVHKKHTEGGDFRQATYRAVRQGLKKGKSVLLEPFYDYKLEVPSELLGRAMSDIKRMSGTFNPPEIHGDRAVLTGSAPVATMRGYHTEVTSYSKGRGRLFCTLKGYLPCHNSDQVIEDIGYDSERDFDNPTGSIFCANGAGFAVEWDRVHEYMHIDSGFKAPETQAAYKEPAAVRNNSYSGKSLEEDKELEAIFVRTYGPIKRRLANLRGGLGYEKSATIEKEAEKQKIIFRKKEPMKEYLLVDGYNIIYAWDELSKLARGNMDAARRRLMDILCNYQALKNYVVILVFDAYKVKGGVGQVHQYHNIHVVYTKEAETADEYIEKATHEIARKHHVTVATSDAVEQLIILGKGAVRISAKELIEEINRTFDEIRRDYLDKQPMGRNYLGEKINVKMLSLIEEDESK